MQQHSEHGRIPHKMDQSKPLGRILLKAKLQKKGDDGMGVIAVVVAAFILIMFTARAVDGQSRRRQDRPAGTDHSFQAGAMIPPLLADDTIHGRHFSTPPHDPSDPHDSSGGSLGDEACINGNEAADSGGAGDCGGDGGGGGD